MFGNLTECKLQGWVAAGQHRPGRAGAGVCGGGADPLPVQPHHVRADDAAPAAGGRHGRAAAAHRAQPAPGAARQHRADIWLETVASSKSFIKYKHLTTDNLGHDDSGEAE